jgi:hypothetical protein
MTIRVDDTLFNQLTFVFWDSAHLFLTDHSILAIIDDSGTLILPEVLQTLIVQ